MTALLATLLARLRSDVVTAVDSAAAGAEADPDAFFAELRRTTDLAIMDCGVSSARASRPAISSISRRSAALNSGPAQYTRRGLQ